MLRALRVASTICDGAAGSRRSAQTAIADDPLRRA